MYKTNNLYQNDEKWKSVPLGNQGKETIGSWGCLLTSITMMLNGAGYNETPETVNQKLKQNGGFDGALLIPSLVPYSFPNILFRTYEPCENRPAPIAQIDAALAAGKPVIVCVDWNPKDSGVQTHWVLLKERKGDNFTMYDPYRYRGDGPDKELILTERYKFQGTKPEEAIHAVIWFDLAGQAAKPPEKPKAPVPADALTVYVAEDDLAFRADPSPSGYLIGRMIAGTALTSLEAKSVAQAKIGQQGQWLQVQDSKGNQGYMAAWYLALSNQPAPTTPAPVPVTPPAPTQPPAGAMIVLPMQADLALRRKPEVTPETLIKRLPETEQMIVVEPAAQAAQKLGAVGQWIQVKDSSGQQGYVAAWYVKLPEGAAKPPVQPAPVKPPATPPVTPTPPAGGILTVRTNTEEVALRSQPVVNDTTLIRRLPINTQLTVVETGGESKIGVMNQWLKVKDPQGSEGYVAAWYVTK